MQALLKRKNLMTVAAVIFTVFEAVMFYLIHISNVEVKFTEYYICIIAAAVFSLLTLIIKIATAKEYDEKIKDIITDKKDGNLIIIAMMFTLVADYFLVALEEQNHLAGVIVFLGTQFFIFLHTYVSDSNYLCRMANIGCRILLSAFAVIAVFLILGDSSDLLSIISVVYYANLCTNILFAHRCEKGGIILTIGLILFALCDINVGLSALNNIYSGGFPKGSFLYNILYSELNLIWIFYIPSQTLIPLTLIFLDKKSENKA